MASSPKNTKESYFGFRDVHGFKDFVRYVILCAPEMFLIDDWRAPNEQMNLDRAFEGLRFGLRISSEERGDSPLLAMCRELVEEAFVFYSSGEDHAGQLKLEEMDKLLRKLPSN